MRDYWNRNIAGFDVETLKHESSGLTKNEHYVITVAWQSIERLQNYRIERIHGLSMTEKHESPGFPRPRKYKCYICSARAVDCSGAGGRLVFPSIALLEADRSTTVTPGNRSETHPPPPPSQIRTTPHSRGVRFVPPPFCVCNSNYIRSPVSSCK